MRFAELNYRGLALRVAVHDRDYISEVLVQTHSFFELEILQYLESRNLQQQTIVDIGANLGNHALFFSQFLRPSRLMCFEPFAKNLQLLRINLAGRAEIYSFALGEQAGMAGLRYNPENLGICIVDRNLPGEIQVRTLDSFNVANVSLLKIDVEGDDLAVLRGAEKTIANCKPEILIEGDELPLTAALHPLGYQLQERWPRYNTYYFSYSR